MHGYAELLHEHVTLLPPDRVARMAGEIYSGSSIMVRLVDDLLDLSRFEQGLVDVRPSRTDLVGVLRSLVDAFRAQPGGERLVAELPEALEAYLDPERLTQAVSNLVINALPYAPAGPIIVRAERRGDDIVVEVADRGPGLAPAAQGRVWEKFYREAAAVNSPNRGSGLGLAVVKPLVELHGGRVGVCSRPGRGATFWFSIPQRETP
ncbi:MAG: HAMP domain-containing histidine kinase [Chloroflexota bacterium]|nr:HAMP domain-containing histidine kinase [Chloroflexota bacterium]